MAVLPANAMPSTTRQLFPLTMSLVDAFADLLKRLGHKRQPTKPEIIEALNKAFLKERDANSATAQFYASEALAARFVDTSLSRQDEEERSRKFFEALFAKVKATVVSVSARIVQVGGRNVRVLSMQAPVGSVAHLLAQASPSVLSAVPGLSPAVMTSAGLGAHLASMPQPSAPAMDDEDDVYSTVVSIGNDTLDHPDARFIAHAELLNSLSSLEGVVSSGHYSYDQRMLAATLCSMIESMKAGPTYGARRHHEARA